VFLQREGLEAVAESLAGDPGGVPDCCSAGGKAVADVIIAASRLVLGVVRRVLGDCSTIAVLQSERECRREGAESQKVDMIYGERFQISISPLCQPSPFTIPKNAAIIHMELALARVLARMASH
jgi:hypothetical protein